MTFRPEEPPLPEELAAYADGELQGAALERIERWLADHPAARAEVCSVARLDDLFRRADPDDLTEARWESVLRRVLDGAETPTSIRTGRRAWPARAAVLAAAAVVLVIVLLAFPRRDRPDHVVTPPTPVEPFQVTSHDDVAIISVDAADAGALAVGAPPLWSPLVLVDPGDVRLRALEVNADGEFPEAWMAAEQKETPMIYAPLLADNR